jgi:hypothetical protein
MEKTTGISLNSLTVSIMSIINGAIMASMMTAGRPFGSRIGTMSVIAKAPQNAVNLNDIPIIGLTDQGINKTFIFMEGQKSHGCITFSEVECTFRDGVSTVLPIFCNVRYDEKTAAWTVQWAQVGIDEEFYRVSFDEDSGVIGDVLVTKGSCVPVGSDLMAHHQERVSVSA